MLLTMIQTDFPETHIGKIYSFRALIGGLGLAMGTFIASFTYKLASIPSIMIIFSLMIIAVGAIGIFRVRIISSLHLKNAS
ncbi:hypothetical protein ACFQ4X_00400 [Fictibacillus halophilus]|uniref:hypothetical protein n=1 Tax=Fictibacillus halophilus TaxID=1610490 RepID=UPI0036389464